MLSPAPGHATGGQRVELNAMTSRQLVDLVEASLIANGVRKVIPAHDMLAETMRRSSAAAAAQTDAALAAELARINAMPVDVPADLDARVRAYWAEHPTATWDDALRAIIGER